MTSLWNQQGQTLITWVLEKNPHAWEHIDTCLSDPGISSLLATSSDIQNAKEWAILTLKRLQHTDRGSQPSLNLPADVKSLLSLDVFDDLLGKRLFDACEALATIAICLGHETEAWAGRIAYLYEEEGLFTATVATMQLALTIEPGNREAVYQLAFALDKLNRSDEAIEHLLPHLLDEPEFKFLRLAALAVRRLGMTGDAISFMEQAMAISPQDGFARRTVAQWYSDAGRYGRALDIISERSDSANATMEDRVVKSLILRNMGRLDDAIALIQEAEQDSRDNNDRIWTQCFNYSIASGAWSSALLNESRKYWEQFRLQSETIEEKDSFQPKQVRSRKLRIGFISGDYGDHVVSRFLIPILRCFNRENYEIELFCTARRFESKAQTIADYASCYHTIHGMSLEKGRALIRSRSLDLVIDLAGFTRDTGLPLLVERCAPLQCHYIGFHSTTGLDTIDYFIGDHITCSAELRHQFSEKVAWIDAPWIGYDSKAIFPSAASTAKADRPVFGSFSQVAKIGSLTLDYWCSALQQSPTALLVIKDKGSQCGMTRQRIESAFKQHGVDPDRIYFIGPVPSQLDHLDSYNAIDIALDTTPWSSATTAFESFGMGVPMVAIYGDSTSGRMSSSVATAAGFGHLIAHSPDEFGEITAQLSDSYREIRLNKAYMQRSVRSGILFDDLSTCNRFFRIVEKLVQENRSRQQC